MPNRDSILIVGNSKDDALLIKCALKEAGTLNPIFVVADYRAAIDYFEGQGKFTDRELHPLPRLVLLNVVMPTVYSGFDLLAWIRSQERFKTTVVILLSSAADEKYISQAYRLGANAYLTKPAMPREFSEMVYHLRAFWLETNQFPPPTGETL